MKRLFVRDGSKGRGIGKKLVEMILAEGKAKGYSIMRLDTFTTMEAALKIYYDFGFYPIDPYVYNPNAGVLYLEKIL
jgi:ribosomal protein S18 acetylase RimI-like enzyme